MEKLKIPYPIIVEGKYDKMRLDNLVEAQIIKTDGFGIFKATEKAALLRTLAKKSPLILLTDSDGAGRVIRSHISSMIPKDRLIQLHIPKIRGKEKRKDAPSAEGFLGVEGMENQFLIDLLKPYEDEKAFSERRKANPITKADLFADGLTGTPDSSARRDALAEKIGLPSGMTPNAFLEALRLLCTLEDYRSLVNFLDSEKK